MCDTITQLSIYSVDRVKLTAMSVSLINDSTDLTPYLFFSGTIGTTHKTLNEILNIKQDL